MKVQATVCQQKYYLQRMNKDFTEKLKCFLLAAGHGCFFILAGEWSPILGVYPTDHTSLRCFIMLTLLLLSIFMEYPFLYKTQTSIKMVNVRAIMK